MIKFFYQRYPNKVASIGEPNSELKSNRMRRVRGQNSYFSVNTESQCRCYRHGHGPKAGGGGWWRRDRVPGRGFPRNSLVTGWSGKPRGYSVSAKVRFNVLQFSERERESSHLIELAQRFLTDFTLHTSPAPHDFN